ncbi:hypothetical protein CJ030_MR6G010881 [Morella rubra]|uniref:Aminotransferase class V domain-containing protein n=1 Tax=Morella rubra TaxID=262757 RepID=A0A6A1VDJ5_9ROSI|nr:hypothetical protein CJ030_MR6G010881 [Morella rubra]
MEFEQLMLGEAFSAQKTKQVHNKTSTASANASLSSNDLPHGSDSSRILEMGLPRHESAETKLSWLRSQIIGGEAEMDTPFGKRRLTYADHTASGRSLRYVEDLIRKNVLPSYGNSHTSDSYVGHRTTKMVHEAAKYIKKCLGGGEDDAIIFCGSGTTAAIKRLQEIDMRSGEIDGYDAIFLSPHKFIGGPGTPGILLMNKILYRLKSSPPSTCGGGTIIYVNGFNERDTLYYEDIEERENGGTPQIIQTVKAALTFWVKEHIGYEARGGCACAGPYAHSLLNVDEAHSLAFRDAFLKGYQGVKPGWAR